MRVLVVGNGAREDALSWRLAASPSCEAVFAAPGNAGTASRGENWEIAATNGKALTDRCLAEAIDLVVLPPESAIACAMRASPSSDRIARAGGLNRAKSSRSALWNATAFLRRARSWCI